MTNLGAAALHVGPVGGGAIVAHRTAVLAHQDARPVPRHVVPLIKGRHKLVGRQVVVRVRVRPARHRRGQAPRRRRRGNERQIRVRAVHGVVDGREPGPVGCAPVVEVVLVADLDVAERVRGRPAVLGAKGAVRRAGGVAQEELELGEDVVNVRVQGAACDDGAVEGEAGPDGEDGLHVHVDAPLHVLHEAEGVRVGVRPVSLTTRTIF